MTPPTVQFIPAAGGEDWDTYSEGIYRNPSVAFSPNASGSFVVSTSLYVSTAPVGFYGWYQSSYPVSRYWNTSGGDTVPPAVAVWDETSSVWRGWSRPLITSATNATLTWSVGGDPGTGYLGGSTSGHNLYFVYLTQLPTDFSNWSNYDGPLS